MNKCSECKKEISINDKFCPNCGCKIKSSHKKICDTTENENGVNYELAIAGLILSIISFGVLMVVSIIFAVVVICDNYNKNNKAKKFGVITLIICGSKIVLAIILVLLFFTKIFQFLF